MTSSRLLKTTSVIGLTTLFFISLAVPSAQGQGKDAAMRGPVAVQVRRVRRFMDGAGFANHAVQTVVQRGVGAAPQSLATTTRQVNFEHFAIKDGLASNQTYQVLQSKQGFILIATRQGLSKFDGAEFINYTHDPDNPKSIASNYIWTMRETSDGALWLSLWGGGLDRFDPATETFTHYRAEKGNPNSLSTNFVNASFPDSKGMIWVATDK